MSEDEDREKRKREIDKLGGGGDERLRSVVAGDKAETADFNFEDSSDESSGYATKEQFT